MRVLVTGGGGFLGSRIAQMLQASGAEVTVLGRNSYPHHDRAGIATIRADLRDAAAVRRACAGKELVFHAGAIAAIWGRRRTFWEINVGGTQNVLDACLALGVRKLVYTSTPSVVFGVEDLCGVDESCPYPSHYLAEYPKTKAIAERAVLAANGATLATVALRPHLIWGPGDPHLIPRVIRRARAGRLTQIGDGTNLVDITYIDNAASAHLLAATALHPGAACAGRAYFISQGEPVALWPWLGGILAAVGAPAVTRSMSYRGGRIVGSLFETLYRLAWISREPPMTRFLATQLAKSHYFCIDAARRDLGYEPLVTTAEGLERLVVWLRGLDQSMADSPAHVANR